MKNSSIPIVYIIALCAALVMPLLAGTGNVAHAQVGLPSVNDNLRRLPRDLEIDRRVTSRVERATEEAAQTGDDLVETAELTVEQAAAQAAALASGLLRELDIGKGPEGVDIEMDVVVVLLESDEVQALMRPGFTVLSERELPALGLTLLTLRKPASTELPQAVQQLRDANPDASIDYNHLYELTSATDAQPAAAAPADTGSAKIDTASNLRIGIIDSAVQRDHPAIESLQIVDRDFATAPGLRPQTHGTAVASLVAKSAANKASIYSASVFFQYPNRAPGATAESLVAALDWLVAEKVEVINMSLAGPGNQLLETAIRKLIDRGAVIVAAVGNNGPSAPPMYPAAYDGVIGVTAVDRKNKVFRYANRGEQVEFAARGVDVKVADSLTGGWRIESGTSMASPHIAVVVAQVLRTETVRPEALVSWLISNAEDLGRKGFDPVYGHGLITRPPVVLSVN